MLKSFASGQIFGQQFGSGKPQVLAIHGWAHTHSDFDQILNGLDGIAIDLPGFGATPAPKSPVDAEGFAELVAPILDQFESPCVIVGHSVGGRVALHLALKFPNRVRALVIVSTPLMRNPAAPKKRAPFSFRIARKLHKLHLLSDSRMNQLRNKYGSRDYRNATGIMRDTLVKLVNTSDEQLLPLTKQPVHLVWAKDDADAPIAIAERAMELFPDATLTAFDDGGHLVPSTHPQELRDIVVKVTES